MFRVMSLVGIIGISLVTDQLRCANGAILASVKGTRKVLPKDKGSSAEERVIDAINPAIANVGARKGFETWVPGENGTWVKYERDRPIKDSNRIREHSTASDERIGSTVEKAVEANWKVVSDVVKASNSEEDGRTSGGDQMGVAKSRKSGERSGNPFPAHLPTVQSTPIRTGNQFNANSKVQPVRLTKVQWSSTAMQTEIQTTQIKEIQALISILLATLFLVIIVAMMFVCRKYKDVLLLRPAKAIFIKPRGAGYGRSMSVGKKKHWMELESDDAVPGTSATAS